MPLPDKSANGEDSGLANAVKNRSAHVVHLTHNDLDAVGADAIHRIKYGNEEVFTIWISVIIKTLKGLQERRGQMAGTWSGGTITAGVMMK
jgi:hypothetical protein